MRLDKRERTQLEDLGEIASEVSRKLLILFCAMFKQIVAAYLWGAITFWPLFGLSVFLAFRFLKQFRSTATYPDGKEDSDGDEDPKGATPNPLPLQYLARFDPTGKFGALDLESGIQTSCWVRLSPNFIALSEFYDNADVQSPKSAKSQPCTAKTSLQKFMNSSSFFSNLNSSNFATKNSDKSLAFSPSRYAISSAGSVNTTDTTRSSASSANTDSFRPKSISKCPKYWAVVRGAQLQLFEDKTERKLLDLFALPQFVVSLWPQTLQEYELFYRKYPIVLLSRTDPEGLISLDMYPGLPPRDAAYFYVENSVEKEDIYFALIEASKIAKSQALDNDGLSLSLGPRDPDIMAQPVRVNKAEAQLLQSTIWNSNLPIDTQWLNALLGRMFLSLKDTKLAEDYLARKFSTKLKPISDSSNIIGEIIVKEINSGSSAPYFSNIKLKELTPEGNLVLSAAISYSGGFKVNLGTTVKLSAVTSLTTVEIPIELAATLRQLKGDLIVRVKPAPSERIWYSFESMPEVDLQIEPTVYDTHISLSMVTKFIRSKILDSLRESLVMPYMDDLCFYDTTSSFYRGGIWESPGKTTDARNTSRNDSIPKSRSKKLSVPEKAEGPHNASMPTSRPLESSPVPRDIPTATSSLSNLKEEIPSLLAPRIRSRGASSSSRDRVEDDTIPIKSASPTAAQRFSNWMRKKRSPREPDSSGFTPALEPHTSMESAVPQNILNLSPGSANQRERASSTTQVTTSNATTSRVPGSNTSASDIQPTDIPVYLSGSPKTSLTSPAKTTNGVPIRRPIPPPSTPKPPGAEHIRKLESPQMPSLTWKSSAEASLPLSKEPPVFTQHAVQRKPLASSPVTNSENNPLDNLEPASISSSGPSTNMSNEVIEGYIPAETILRRNSLTSLHSRRSSQPLETGSIRSNASNPGPILPPRRRVVPLSNVAPESV